MATTSTRFQNRTRSSSALPNLAATISTNASSPAAVKSNNISASSGTNTTAAAMTTKPRRPSLPILSASASSIPTQRALQPSSTSQLLQPVKETPKLRSQRSLPRLSVERNDSSLLPCNIARPASALSSTRTYSSASSSPRLASIARFGDPQRAGSVTSSTTLPSSVKPTSKSTKGVGIKPPSIVTAATAMRKGSSLPPIAPPPNSSLQTPQTSSPSTFPSSPLMTSSAATAAPVSAPISPSSISGSSVTRSKNRIHAGIDSGCFMTRSASEESLVSTSASSSVATTPIIPEVQVMTSNTTAAAAITSSMATMTHPAASTFSSALPKSINSRLSASSLRKPMSRRPSCADLNSGSVVVSLNSTPAPTSGRISQSSIHTVHNDNNATAAKISNKLNPTRVSLSPTIVRPRGKSFSSFSSTPGAATTSMSSAASTSRTNVNNLMKLPTSPMASPEAEKHELQASREEAFTTPVTEFNISTVAAAAVKCNCPPPLEFPENVKREMKREEEEHRQRECSLYSKIIELQIENENLKGEKEILNRVLSRRELALLEVQIQLQAVEFFCRENNIKVDIDVCPDEAIENWCFKESDAVYERILLVTQELLRNGSRCLEENMSRSSSHQSRSTRSSTMTHCSMDRASIAGFRGAHVVAGISDNVQPLVVQDQGVDPIIFKETSRPGTLKFDLQTLLRSEQEFNNHQHSMRDISLHPMDTNHIQDLSDIAPSSRKALDGEDDRLSFFRAYAESDKFRFSNEDEAADIDDEDDEGQDSEFEELGEDMIKFVELQSSVTPRRESRSMSFSKMNQSNTNSAAATPDLSAAVLVKNLWSGGPRRNSSVTPMRQNSQPGTLQHSRSLSPLPPPPPPSQAPPPAPVGLGLQFLPTGRSPEPHPLQRFLHSAPVGAPPKPPE